MNAELADWDHSKNYTPRPSNLPLSPLSQMSHQHHSGYYQGHPRHPYPHPHSSSRNLTTQYPTAPTAPAAPAPAPVPTRPNPGALASGSGVILHQPYPNSVGVHPTQAQYPQRPTAHRPTPSSSSAAPPPPIPTQTRPVDMPASPVRPGSTHYGVSLHLLASAPSISVEHQWNECSRIRSRSRSTRSNDR